MFLLRSIELIALIGLFVQTFLAWVFMAVLAALGDAGGAPGTLRNFRRAFGALAVALTAMSVRFFRARDVDLTARWEPDSWQVLSCYAIYMGAKGVFGLALVAASHQLVGRAVPARLNRWTWPCATLLAASPLVFPGINELLVVQAPVMIASSLAALFALRPARPAQSGLRIVRWSLIGLGATWILHAIAVSARGTLWAHYVLSSNSYADLAVQLALGIGLVVSLLQAAQQRQAVAEREREAMRGALERDEKLRALGTVVSGVAHELNNPLTVILGYADVLRDQSPAVPEAEIIVEQAERCRGIVRNLSALAGQSVHPRESLELEDLARRVVRGLSTADGPTVCIEPMGGLRLAADRTGLEQVLANLVANARHAASPGGRVALRARRIASEVEIAIEDDGRGVAIELRERIFEPFFSTKGPGGGTGLGLSIAHAIVRAHGGTIRVEDGPAGRGATFVVTLPLSPPSARLAREAPPERSRSVLIVDDEPSVRSILRQQAARRGWSVVEADSAEDALERDLDAFDAILCDLRMPGIGGIELHDRLARNRDAALARFVFATGDLASPDPLRFSHRCEQPLLTKPFDFGELFAELAAVADARPRG